MIQCKKKGVIIISTVTAYNLRLKNLMFRKLRYISKIKHRSLNSQITLLVEEFIQNYEKINGKINEEELLNSEEVTDDEN